MTPPIFDRSIPKWRFESIDARAGIAFAVWRPERTAVEWAPPDHAPCLFFGPPAFQPEPVANVAIAMSAARGPFEPGLYIDGREAYFERPEDVGEFLRRGYVGSGGGDGGDGGGEGPGPVPPPPEPRENDGSFFPGYESSEFTRYLIHSIEALQQISGETSFGQSVPSPLAMRREAQQQAPMPYDADSIVSGALHVMLELVRRMPRLHGLGSEDERAAALRWQHDARCLGAFVERLGLTDVLFVDYHEALEKALDAVRPQVPKLWQMDGWLHRKLHPAARYHILFLDGPLLDDDDALEQRFHRFLEISWRFGYPTLGWQWQHRTPVGVIEFLQQMPLPREISSLLAGDLGERNSVYHLLCVLLGQAVALRAPANTLGKALDIAMFAAACIATPQGGMTRPSWTTPPAAPTDLQYSQARSLARRAAAWLMEHMPERVFARGYEEYLGRTKYIRYRPISGAPQPGLSQP